MKDNGFNSEMCSDLLTFLCSSGKDWDSKGILLQKYVWFLLFCLVSKEISESEKKEKGKCEKGKGQLRD